MGKLLMVAASLVIAVGGALLAEQARAADENDQAIEACHGRQSTVEIVECLGTLNEQWDKRLNEAYQAVLGKADPSAVAPLRASERAWLEYRQQRCLYAYMSEGGGTMRQILAADCFLRMMIARTDELAADAAHQARSGG
jgi:uncharacterized protein YecT (DUF1311 family)